MRRTDHDIGPCICTSTRIGSYENPLMAATHSLQIFFGTPLTWMCRMLFSSDSQPQTTHFTIFSISAGLVSCSEIITRLVFPHRSRMLSMIWLKADINWNLLHRLSAAGWFLLLCFYDGFFLTSLTLIIINSHAVISHRHIGFLYLKLVFFRNIKFLDGK